MIEFRSFYQFGYFLPHGVTASPEMIAKLVLAFKELRLLPSTIPSFQIGPDQRVSNGLQLQLITENRNLMIDFEPHRYLIQKLQTPEIPLGSHEEFSKSTKDIIDTLNQIVDIKASRMSFVTKGLCKSMNNEELEKVNDRLFNLPAKLKTLKPIEWSTRQVCREQRTINSKEEQLNIIMDINRIQGTLNANNISSPFDGIEIGFDFNTFQGNSIQRFNKDDVQPFLIEMKSIQDELESSIDNLFHEQTRLQKS